MFYSLYKIEVPDHLSMGEREYFKAYINQKERINSIRGHGTWVKAIHEIRIKIDLRIFAYLLSK